ncbi:MAG: DUF2283 domain-containing protein [Methanobrevibacter sp.]|jgi:hypothetical protein|nr:DUF2283 domain-containing protein [Candidatus Methanovirga aequatorialis]
MNQNKTFEIETEYDYQEDIFDITVKERYDYRTSLELAEGVILDFDENNIPGSLYP